MVGGVFGGRPELVGQDLGRGALPVDLGTVEGIGGRDGTVNFAADTRNVEHL